MFKVMADIKKNTCKQRSRDVVSNIITNVDGRFISLVKK